MTNACSSFTGPMAAIALLLASASTAATSGDLGKIQPLENRSAAAIVAKAHDRIMSVYAPGEDLFIFEVVPLRQFIGG